MSKEDVHPVVGAIVGLVAFATFIFSDWCVVLAFVGGDAPLFGWHFEGSFGQGLLWLLVVTPALTTAAWWITALVTMPLAAILRR